MFSFAPLALFTTNFPGKFHGLFAACLFFLFFSSFSSFSSLSVSFHFLATSYYTPDRCDLFDFYERL